MTSQPVTIAELFAGTHDVIRLVNSNVTENYLARDRVRNRAVLLKVLPVRGESNASKRFLRNAPLLERIRHPGIETFVEFGQRGDACYFAVDFVEGETLWQRIRREPSRTLSVPLALEYARQLCEALAAAHAADVVHGDLSPDRVLVQEGWVVITDVGILRVLAPMNDDGKSGGFTGNPTWLAPEQVSGGALGFPVDVFGVGCLLYFMLTGEPPFKGDSALAVVKAIAVDPRPRYAANPAIDAVIQRAMAIDPKARYQTMRELADALRSVGAV